MASFTKDIALRFILGAFFLLCVNREVDTPCTIPNQEVKHFIADNTVSFRYGNVGRCKANLWKGGNSMQTILNELALVAYGLLAVGYTLTVCTEIAKKFFL